MRGTPSCNTTSACLPMARRTWQQARAEPTASPSGRACEVSTKRSCCPICRSTFSSTLLGLLSTGFPMRLVALFRPLQQLFYPGLVLLGAIEAEIQFRGTPYAQTFHQFMADIFARGFQAFQALIGVGIVAFDIDPDFCGASVVRDVNRGDADKTDARVSQFAFHKRFDLFAQSLAHPSAMIFEPALLHETSPQVKRMRISENVAPVLRQGESRLGYCPPVSRRTGKYGGNNMLGIVAFLRRGEERFQGFKVSRFQGFKVSRFQGFKVSRFQGFKVSRFLPKTVSTLAGLEIFDEGI